MPHLTLALLGGFQVELDGRPVTGFKSNKVRALLAYLAVEADRPHRREMLAGLLWPDRPDRDALNNLRYSLANLRKTLDDRSSATPFLLIDRNTVQFNRASDAWLDADQLLGRIAAARGPHAASDLSPPAIADLQSALALYRGSLLESFSAGDAGPFEEWLLLRREQIAQQVARALASLAATFEARGDYAQAQALARRHVALEPWNEDAHRALMRALALNGQRSAALHQFQACRGILAEELGVEPAEETVALFEAIRQGGWVDKEIGNYPGGTRKQGMPAGGTRGATRPAPPLVARESQLSRLDQALAAALAGAGRVMFVAGEAGSGKTALLGEFTRRAMQSHAGLLVAHGACDAATGVGDPYLPFREILQLLTGDIEPKRAGAALTLEHARRLWTASPDAIQALATHGPDLIDTFVPGASLELRAQAFAGQSQRGAAWQTRLAQRVQAAAANSLDVRQALQVTDIFQQVTRVIQDLARQHPLVLVLDDLQWADAGSISLLFHLGRRLAASRILVVAAYRPDAIAAPSDRELHPLALVVHELQRISGQKPVDLDVCDGRPFVDALLDSEPNRLDAAFRQQLYRRTEGHPLFTVELLQSMEEVGDLVRDGEGRWMEGRALHWDSLPTRIESAIGERIERLPEHCHAMLAAASIEGEEFTAEVVAHVLSTNEPAVIQCLSSDLGDRRRLVSAVSIRRLGARKISRYRFRHNLFQRYLYDHMDPVRRAHLHEGIGDALESLLGETPQELREQASRLAWHFEMAGLADRAAAYRLQAGRLAAQLAAHEDAINHFTRGLALLEPLPDSVERARQKLDLQLAVISPLALARGFWAPERIDALDRAYHLSQQAVLRDSPERAAALAAVAYFSLWSAEPARTREMGEQLLSLAEQNQDPHQLLLAHCFMGCARWLQADTIAAREHLDRALACYVRGSQHPLHMLFGFHAGVMSMVWQSAVLWLLGYPDQAVRCLQEALGEAQEEDDPVTLAYAHSAAGLYLFLMGRDAAAAQQQIEALRTLRRVGPVFESLAEILAGRGTIEEKPDVAGLQRIRRGIIGVQGMGAAISHAAQLALLAQGCVQTGQTEAGLEALDEAMTWMDQTGVHVFEAEAHRLRGDLVLAGQPRGEETARSAEACFRNAIAVARRSQMRWWELRATASLCRLLHEQSAPDDDRRAEARQMLAETYGWFSEGFGTLDLREARETLEATGEGKYHNE
jgi:DNA-binding SARP family transcriptional activator